MARLAPRHRRRWRNWFTSRPASASLPVSWRGRRRFRRSGTRCAACRLHVIHPGSACISCASARASSVRRARAKARRHECRAPFGQALMRQNTSGARPIRPSPSSRARAQEKGRPVLRCPLALPLPAPRRPRRRTHRSPRARWRRYRWAGAARRRASCRGRRRATAPPRRSRDRPRADVSAAPRFRRGRQGRARLRSRRARPASAAGVSAAARVQLGVAANAVVIAPCIPSPSLRTSREGSIERVRRLPGSPSLTRVRARRG